MSKKIPTGIALNLARHYQHGQIFDRRTVAQVEESRDMTNRRGRKRQPQITREADHNPE